MFEASFSGQALLTLASVNVAEAGLLARENHDQRGGEETKHVLLATAKTSAAGLAMRNIAENTYLELAVSTQENQQTKKLPKNDFWLLRNKQAWSSRNLLYFARWRQSCSK